MSEQRTDPPSTLADVLKRIEELKKQLPESVPPPTAPMPPRPWSEVDRDGDDSC